LFDAQVEFVASQMPKDRAGDQVLLKVEDIIGDGMGGQEPLGQAV
jgi:hypothetical protein